MTADQSVLLVATLVYLALVLGVSVWGYRRATTEDEFLAAGRTIGPWVGGAVLAATQISAGTFVGTLGRHYLTGVSWVWIWFGVWTGWLLSAMFVAPKLRRFGALTVADYVGHPVRQRGRADAGRGPDHRLLFDSADGAVPGHRRDCLGRVRGGAAAGHGAAPGQYRLLHRPGRRAGQLVHRVHPDADHGAGARLRRAGGARPHRRPDGAGRVRRGDRAARHRVVVQRGRSCWPSAWPSGSASPPRPTR